MCQKPTKIFIFSPQDLSSGESSLWRKNTKYGGGNQHIKIFITALFIAKIKCIYIETDIQQENAMQPFEKKKPFYINTEN